MRQGTCSSIVVDSATADTPTLVQTLTQSLSERQHIMDAAPEHVNEYEAQRAARIAANRQRMEEMGVLQAAQQLKTLQQKPMRWRPPNQKKKAEPVDLVATRVSKRIRGQPIEATVQEDVHQIDQIGDSSSKGGKKAKQDPNEPRFQLTDTQYMAPFMINSIGVTVHALGVIYRGPFSINYWSSRGCLYRHAYPVGYHASKEAFGHIWDMKISAAEGGPVFTVSQRDGPRIFSGPSPTRPWTDVCLAFRPGQRISGPLYFGFSDVHVQRALAASYTPAELAYALYSTSLTATTAAAAAPDTQQQPGSATGAAGALNPSAGPSSSGSCDTTQQQQQQQQQQQPASEDAGEQQLQAQGLPAAEEPKEPSFELTDTQYVAPFTLNSVGVTVHALGEIYRGPFGANYWSSRGMYRHAYPVGYHASKEAFGHIWDMKISAAEKGPVFTVSQRDGPRSFTGASPTRPWTDICLAFRPGQRISGPLYFGFSDVHVQRALTASYTPAELAYALCGTSGTAAAAPATQQQPGSATAAAGALNPSAGPSSSGSCDSTQQQQQQASGDADQQQQAQGLCAAEAFAAELQGIRGIGAATAQVLALTKALGGARHGSLCELCRWLAADTQHAAQLHYFLLNSEEVPWCSRQLPSWREKWVPMIMQQLAQLQNEQQQQQQQQQQQVC